MWWLTRGADPRVCLPPAGASAAAVSSSAASGGGAAAVGASDLARNAYDVLSRLPATLPPDLGEWKTWCGAAEVGAGGMGEEWGRLGWGTAGVGNGDGPAAGHT